MKDYAVQIRIKNNWFLQRMHAAGFEKAADLSRASGIARSQIGQSCKPEKVFQREQTGMKDGGPLLCDCRGYEMLARGFIPAAAYLEAAEKKHRNHRTVRRRNSSFDGQ